MTDLSPAGVLLAIAHAIPRDCLDSIIVVGSLAAGFHFFGRESHVQVRTKDVDCIISPAIETLTRGKDIAERLLAGGWTHRQTGEFSRPGTADDPDEKLPAIRLCPPKESGWYLEFLTVPDSEAQTAQKWNRVQLTTGHFGVPAFRYSALMVFDAHESPYGLRYARPELMALANLLEHQTIGAQTMSENIGGRKLKRANKDLGRVLAIARLDAEGTSAWLNSWQRALRTQFPDSWRTMAGQTGTGLRALLKSEDDLDQAALANNNGLLSSQPATAEQLRASGLRLLQDVIEPFEAKGPA